MDYEINRHQLKSQNVRRKLRVYQSFLANISQRRNRERYQKRKKYDYTLFRVHLHYSINKVFRINVFSHPWNHYWSIWVMDMHHNTSSGLSKIIFWKIKNKGQMQFCRDILLGHHKEKNEKRLNYHTWEWHTTYFIWYISECILLSNCVIVTRCVASDQSFYYILR